MNRIPLPDVLECMNFISEGVFEHRRTVKNYEFDLYLDGERKIIIDGVSHKVEAGSLVFRRPGQFTIGKGDYNMYLITLDFSHSVSDEQKLFRGINGECQKLSNFSELEDIPTVFKPPHYEELKRLYEHLSRCSFPALADYEKQKGYIKEFLMLILYDSQIYNRKRKLNSKEKTDIAKQTHDYILEHFSEQIKIKDIATMIFVNENHLIQTFKKKYSITPNQYLLEIRLVYAKYLLLYSEHSVKEVALSCGFNTPSYFIKKFKEHFHRTPCNFRPE